jgi:hypothetical protein
MGAPQTLPHPGPGMSFPPLVIPGMPPLQIPPIVFGDRRFEHVFEFPADRIDNPDGNVILVANMWGFAVGSATLLPDHRAFLAQKVGPILKMSPDAGARMIGIASRSGSADFNLKLGLARAKNAKAELNFWILPHDLMNPPGPPERITVGSQGENFAARMGIADGSEQARHRAVLVTVLRDRRKPTDVTLKK